MKEIGKKRYAKMALQKGIGILPAAIAFPLNEFSTRIMRGKAATRVDTLQRANKCLDNLEKIRRRTAFVPLHARVLEIGTGWHGIDLVVLKALGAKRIVTVDHWRHLTRNALYDSTVLIRQKIDSLRLASLVSRTDVIDRLDDLVHSFEKHRQLESILEAWNVCYTIIPSCDVSRSKGSAEATDLFYSESVLHRIPIEELRKMIRYVGHSLLVNGGIVFARTDQKDIHSQDHADSGVWGLDYLKYSDFTYRLMSSRKLNWQNRLRESDFVRLFKDTGIDIVHVESQILEDDVQRLSRTTQDLADRFRQYNLRDLATRASLIIGTK